MKNYYCTSIIFVIFIFVVGCQSSHRVRIKNNTKYCVTKGVFKSRWYNYYERSLSCMEGGFYEEALLDINEAINQRSEDENMARTYGVRFIAYFPHREKGLIYFHMKKYEASKEELQLSIQQEPSAKAYFYLDKIRKFELSQKNQQISSPKIVLDYSKSQKQIIEEGEIWTKELSLELEGTANDENYVSEIWFNNEKYYFEPTAKKVTFKKTLNLSKGRQEVEIKAKNLMNTISKKKIVINVDNAGPLILIKGIDIYGNLSGELVDESELMSLTVNRKNVSIKQKKRDNFNVPAVFENNCIKVFATDILNNTNTLIIHKNLEKLLSLNVFAENVQHATVSDSFTSPIATKGDTSIEIELPGFNDYNVSYKKDINMKGTVACPTYIKKVSINNITLDSKKNNKIIKFDHKLTLNKGLNDVILRAIGNNGNYCEKKIQIDRKIPVQEQKDQRIAVVVQDVSQLNYFKKSGLIETVRSFFDNSDKKNNPNYFKKLFIEHAKKKDRFNMIDCHSKIIGDANISLYIDESNDGIEILAIFSTTAVSEKYFKDLYRESDDNIDFSSMVKELHKHYCEKFKIINSKVDSYESNMLFTKPHQNNIQDWLQDWPVIVYKKRNISEIFGADADIIAHARISNVESNGYNVKVNDINLNIQDQLYLGTK